MSASPRLPRSALNVKTSPSSCRSGGLFEFLALGWGANVGAKSYNSGMAGAARRGYGEDGIYFDHRGRTGSNSGPLLVGQGQLGSTILSSRPDRPAQTMLWRRSGSRGGSRRRPGPRSAAEVVKPRPQHRGFCERCSQICHGASGKPRYEQYGDSSPIGVQIAAGGEVRVKQAFQESEGPGEPAVLARSANCRELRPNRAEGPDAHDGRCARSPACGWTQRSSRRVTKHCTTSSSAPRAREPCRRRTRSSAEQRSQSGHRPGPASKSRPR